MRFLNLALGGVLTLAFVSHGDKGELEGILENRVNYTFLYACQVPCLINFAHFVGWRTNKRLQLVDARYPKSF